MDHGFSSTSPEKLRKIPGLNEFLHCNRRVVLDDRRDLRWRSFAISILLRSLPLVKDRAQVAFGFQLRTKPGDRFGRADDQTTILQEEVKQKWRPEQLR
jgi:hypothetical protein